MCKPSTALWRLPRLQVLPKAACSGIESTSPGCTDAIGEYLWANAYSEALGVGLKYSHGTPDWAMMLNAPNRRGVHQVGRGAVACWIQLQGCSIGGPLGAGSVVVSLLECTACRN
jgi:hypothetical protein